MRLKLLNSSSMFWIKSRKLSQISFLFSALLIFGCTSEVKDEVEVQTKSNELTEEELMIRQVENSLGITAAEKYDIQIEYKYINADTLQDARSEERRVGKECRCR